MSQRRMEVNTLTNQTPKNKSSMFLFLAALPFVVLILSVLPATSFEHSKGKVRVHGQTSHALNSSNDLDSNRALIDRRP